jgi:hypothetical protein
MGVKMTSALRGYRGKLGHCAAHFSTLEVENAMPVLALIHQLSTVNFVRNEMNFVIRGGG